MRQPDLVLERGTPFLLVKMSEISKPSMVSSMDKKTYSD